MLPAIDKFVGEMTKEDFDSIPYYTKTVFDPAKESFNSIVIIPTEELHSSGYRCMDYVIVSNDYKPVCKLSGISDILEIDGIGGYGLNSISGCEKNSKGQYSIPVKGWQIDCLPCGYLRLFANYKLYLSPYYIPTSSFEIYAQSRGEDK